MPDRIAVPSLGVMYTCPRCGERIGSYEPVMWLGPEGEQRGSVITLSTRPDFDPKTDRIVHAKCAMLSAG
jgi:hypothetical protein